MSTGDRLTNDSEEIRLRIDAMHEIFPNLTEDQIRPFVNLTEDELYEKLLEISENEDQAGTSTNDRTIGKSSRRKHQKNSKISSGDEMINDSEEIRLKIDAMHEIFPNLTEDQIRPFANLTEDELYEKLLKISENDDQAGTLTNKRINEESLSFSSTSQQQQRVNRNNHEDQLFKKEQIAEALWSELLKIERRHTNDEIKETPSKEEIIKIGLFFRDRYPRLRMGTIYELLKKRDFFECSLILGLCDYGLEERLRKSQFLPSKSVAPVFNENHKSRELEAKNANWVDLPKFALNMWKSYQAIIKNTISSYEQAMCFKCSACRERFETKNAISCHSLVRNHKKEVFSLESHSFCVRCVEAHASTANAYIAAVGIGVKCLRHECDGVIFEAHVTPILTESQQNAFTKKLLKVALDQAHLENLERCQHCEFAVVIEAAKEVHSVFRCKNPKCGYKFCRLCEKDYNERHEGKKCDQVMNADTAHVFNFLFFHANVSPHRNLICRPDPLKDQALAISGIEHLNGALTGYCTRCVFSTWEIFELFLRNKHTMDKANLLLWLSKRLPVMCRLPPRFRVKSVKTENQYVLPPVSTEKEECLKNAGGQSFFAFHGSPVENWYKILSEGLMVASGTVYQLSGASFGAGIYLGKDAVTSQGYSQKNHSKMRFNATQPYDMKSPCLDQQHLEKNRVLHKGTFCLALVEVVDDRSKYKEMPSCFVVKDADIVQIRVLFIYDTASKPFPQLDIANFAEGNPDTMRVRQAMSFFMNGDYRERLAQVTNPEIDQPGTSRQASNSRQNILSNL
ncbi:unnamed protein product, partial [Mesorhabditis belari]|uniref:C2H2-type domain-containing protein n=1 Tax=Mesorhabditis belari TaxID=2138241 RepID=A0AAF3EKR4_9BILA